MELPPIPPPDDEADVDLLAKIESHGWAVLGIPPEGDDPIYSVGFSYTIGLVRNFDHPEIIVTGLPHEIAHRTLNNCGLLIREGTRFEAGSISDQIANGFDTTFCEVPKSQFKNHLGYATWFNASDHFPVLQLVYPDAQGRWPWADGVHPGFVERQPILAAKKD